MVRAAAGCVHLRVRYEAVAAKLRRADQILIVGSGTGASSATDQLVADLNHNHGDVAKYVVGSIVVDGHHLTEGQLLARAREFFASTGRANAS